jgi:nicotinamide-nucleotide adenylyltransferase
MRSLFVGRFQPIHKGHLHTIKQILDSGEDLIIAIGSAQYSHTPDNPFSGGERMMLVKRALIDKKLPLDRIDIVPLPDINIHPLWVAHTKSLVPYFKKAYSHNPLVRRLLKDAGVKIGKTDLLDRATYSARQVRALMRAGDKSWEALLPTGVVELIKEHKLDRRVKEIGEVRQKR